MRTPTLTPTGGPSTQNPTLNRLRSGEDYRSLWAMSAAERVAAMWRSELMLRQFSQWSSRAQHEVPLLGGEFAWIVMRTPEWAETDQSARAGCAVSHRQEVDQ